MGRTFPKQVQDDFTEQIREKRMQLENKKKEELDAGFLAAFGQLPQRYFSAPGRTEIGGNHTDHQGGRVLAAAVELDTVAAVRPNGTDTIRVLSKGYPLCRIRLQELTPRPEESNTTAALVRGVAAGFARLGCPLEGFDAYCQSRVLPGSGLSSSAAFEVLLGTVINSLFFGGSATDVQIARIGQQAENRFFGKPCGLMDQMASAVGGLVAMDFFRPEAPEVKKLAFDVSQWDYRLCIIDTRASHYDLTAEYAAIGQEMGRVARCFGKPVLSQVPEAAFFARLPELRQQCGDRAVLRSLHYFGETARAAQQAQALEAGDTPRFLDLVRQSGRSSYMYLQNVTVTGATEDQPMAVVLALCERLLQGRGACRVHGGGFGGTVQAFVPETLLESFVEQMEAVLGPGACHVLSIRSQGGTELRV